MNHLRAVAGGGDGEVAQGIARGVHRVGAICNGMHAETSKSKAGGEKITDVRLVIDDKYLYVFHGFSFREFPENALYEAWVSSVKS